MLDTIKRACRAEPSGIVPHTALYILFPECFSFWPEEVDIFLSACHKKVFCFLHLLLYPGRDSWYIRGIERNYVLTVFAFIANLRKINHLIIGYGKDFVEFLKSLFVIFSIEIISLSFVISLSKIESVNPVYLFVVIDDLASKQKFLSFFLVQISIIG